MRFLVSSVLLAIASIPCAVSTAPRSYMNVRTVEQYFRAPVSNPRLPEPDNALSVVVLATFNHADGRLPQEALGEVVERIRASAAENLADVEFSANEERELKISQDRLWRQIEGYLQSGNYNRWDELRTNNYFGMNVQEKWKIVEAIANRISQEILGISA